MNKILSIILIIFAYSTVVYADTTDDILQRRRSKNRSIVMSQRIDSVCNSIEVSFKNGSISQDSLYTLSSYHYATNPQISEHCLKLLIPTEVKAIGELGALYALHPKMKDKKDDGALLLQEAIEQSYDKASTYLAIYYFFCKEYDLAWGCFNQSDYSFLGNASYCLAYMNVNGLGVEQNLKKGLEYYIKASEFGVVDAQNKAAHQLEIGDGCDSNLSEAFKWYYIAADTGDDWARVWLSLPRIKRDADYVSPYNQQQLAALTMLEGLNKDSDFKTKKLYGGFKQSLVDNFGLAAQNDAIANYYLATLYYNGDFIDKNPQEAFKFYSKALESNNLKRLLKGNAAYRLGVMYRYGRGVDMNVEMANYWTKIAALNGNQDAYKLIESWML